MLFCQNIYSKHEKKNKNDTSDIFALSMPEKRIMIYAIKGIHANRTGKKSIIPKIKNGYHFKLWAGHGAHNIGNKND